ARAAFERGLRAGCDGFVRPALSRLAPSAPGFGACEDAVRRQLARQRKRTGPRPKQVSAERRAPGRGRAATVRASAARR
ncbi:hypothetical protein NCPPB3923_11185, partial [Burkholderia glumae]